MNEKNTLSLEMLGRPGHRTLIRGCTVLSMDPKVGDFARADVLLEGAVIAAVGPSLPVQGAFVIEGQGKVAIPGFIDTHHHQFATALRGLLVDALLTPDGSAQGEFNYSDIVLGKFAPAYRPQDVHISELVGAFSHIDAGVTTALDVSQIHHSPEHSDAVVDALREAGQRCLVGYFEGRGAKCLYPEDAPRLRRERFSSDDALLTLAMGGEIYLPGYERSWAIARELGIPIACHIVASLGMVPEFDKIMGKGLLKDDLILIHMTGMSDEAWSAAAAAGARVSIAVPIEMSMRHGPPPIQTALDHGIQPSLSTDVECTFCADLFTQMRSALTFQRNCVNESVLDGETPGPALLTARDVLRFATIEGARTLGLASKVGSLTPGKRADLLLLDAEAINAVPMNYAPGTVVGMMDRSNVDTVFIDGRVRKWQGELVGPDLQKLRQQLNASRDYLFNAAGVAWDPLRARLR